VKRGDMLVTQYYATSDAYKVVKHYTKAEPETLVKTSRMLMRAECFLF